MIEIRLATEADTPAIAAIYNQAVEAGFQTGDRTPVSTDSRKLWLQAHPSSRYPVYVLDIDGSVAGWLSVSPYRPGREALRFTAEISYYVERAQRGKGVASRLLAYAIEQAPKLGVADNFIWPARSKIVWPSVWGMKKAGLLARPALAERERSV